METNEIWLETLFTKTPQEGRELAIKLLEKVLPPYKLMLKNANN
jgi:hypothetical protein